MTTLRYDYFRAQLLWLVNSGFENEDVQGLIHMMETIESGINKEGTIELTWHAQSAPAWNPPRDEEPREQIVCPSCGQPALRVWGYCGHCGEPMET